VSNHAAALHDASEALRLQPDDSLLQYWQALAYLATGDHAQSRATLQYAYECDSTLHKLDSAIRSFWTGVIAEHERCHDAAQAAFEQAIQEAQSIDDDNHRKRVLAYCAVMQGRPEQARVYYSEILRDQPCLSEFIFARVILRYLEGLFPDRPKIADTRQWLDARLHHVRAAHIRVK